MPSKKRRSKRRQQPKGFWFQRRLALWIGVLFACSLLLAIGAVAWLTGTEYSRDSHIANWAWGTGTLVLTGTVIGLGVGGYLAFASRHSRPTLLDLEYIEASQALLQAAINGLNLLLQESLEEIDRQAQKLARQAGLLKKTKAVVAAAEFVIRDAEVGRQDPGSLHTRKVSVESIVGLKSAVTQLNTAELIWCRVTDMELPECQPPGDASRSG